jgi:alkylation response protein AidB-like acyl-CoA dehydrogenase
MNFDFNDKQRAIRTKIKGLFDQDAKAALDQLEGVDTDQVRDALLHCLKILGKEGYLDLGLENGEDSMALVAAQESLATTSSSLFLSIEVNARIFGRLISLCGTPEQKSNILPSLKEGQLIGTVALSEEGMSIENNPLNTTGVPRNDGYNVSGSKGHVVNAPVADWIAVAGMMEKGIAFFLINKDSEGLSIGQRLSTLGYNGSAIAAITLENCPVPKKGVIGPFEGVELLKTVRMWEDQILTAASLGLMHRCFDVASNYAKSHMSGGKPIIAYQEVGFKLAEMLTLLQTAQLLAYRASWMTETRDKEVGGLVHCAKVFCAESAEEVASKALQILGGHGYLRGNPAEEGYRDAKYLQIAGTSSEISRMKIGDRVLEWD